MSAAEVGPNTGGCQKVRAEFDHGVPAWESLNGGWEYQHSGRVGVRRAGGMIEPVRRLREQSPHPIRFVPPSYFTCLAALKA